VFNSDYLLFIIIIIKFGITGCYSEDKDAEKTRVGL